MTPTPSIASWENPTSSQKTQLVDVYHQSFYVADGESEANVVTDLLWKIFDTPCHDWFCHVATLGETLIGAACWTRLQMDKTSAFLLSPVAVASTHQGQGVGQKLIKQGIEHLRQNQIPFALTYGDPNFYQKTGFIPIDDKIIIPPHPLSQPFGWLGLSVLGVPISTLNTHKPIKCINAFDDPAVW